MNDSLQTIIVLSAIVGAASYLLLRGRKKKCATDGCGCATNKVPVPTAPPGADSNEGRKSEP